MLNKKYLKSKPECKVTFRLHKKYIGNVDSVNLIGDANDWNNETNPMKKLKNGDFKIEINLKVGKEYQFRYKVNNTYWVNDDQADKYIPSPFPHIDNSVICV